MDGFLTSLRSAIRPLFRSRAFAIVSIVTLGVAIGATTAIFSVVDAVLLRPLPYPEPDELVTLRLDVDSEAVDDLPFSDRGFWHFHDASRSFEHFGGYTVAQLPLVGDGEPVQVTVGVMTVDAFVAVGLAPAQGRFPDAEEDVPNGPRVALVSSGLWADRFGSDPNILDRTIDLNGQTFQVIGVMPPGYNFPTPEVDIWVPYGLNRESENFGGHHIQAVARLRDGVDIDVARAEASSLIARFGEAGYGPEWLDNVFTGQAIVSTVMDGVVGDSRRPLFIVLGTVALVLLIACGNVANLLLVRAESRSRETAVRSALGAGRWRLVRDVLAESVVLSIVGGLLGLLLAYAGTRILVAAAPAAIPRLDEVRMSGTVLLFTSGIAIGAGLLFGLFPAFRVGSGRYIDILRDGGRSATIGKDRHRARSLLVIGQVALALVLLVGSGLMVRSFQELRSVHPGFRAEGVLTFGLSLPPLRYREPESTARFMDQLVDRLEAIPGVVSAAGINTLPLTGGGAVLATQIEDFPVAPGDFPPAFAIRRVTPGYFETMGIPLVEGRTFEGRDHEQRLGSAIISASLKDQYWPEGSTIGKRLQPSAAPVSVVGVVGNVHDGGLDSPPEQIIYLPMLDSIGGGVRAMNVTVRTEADPLALMPGIRRAIAELDPALPITDVRTMGGIVEESISRTTFTMSLLVLAAFVALFLGSVGIYGVISYVVTQRTAEMGIRQALGAAPGQVRGLIMRQGMMLAGTGVLVGLIAAAWLGRSLSSLLYGIGSFDPISFFIGSISFLGVAALASLLPARRAARIQPAIALREE